MKHNYIIISLFNDYIYRDESFSNYYFYDYCSQFYKFKWLNDLSFDSSHSQYDTYTQFLRDNSFTIFTLFEKMLFIKFDFIDTKKVNDYYYLIIFIFFSWSHKQSSKLSTESWEEFIVANQNDLYSHLKWYIYNFNLLYKLIEDIKIH